MSGYCPEAAGGRVAVAAGAWAHCRPRLPATTLRPSTHLPRPAALRALTRRQRPGGLTSVADCSAPRVASRHGARPVSAVEHRLEAPGPPSPPVPFRFVHHWPLHHSLNLQHTPLFIFIHTPSAGTYSISGCLSLTFARPSPCL